MTIVWIAALFAFAIIAAGFRVFRKLTRPQVSASDMDTSTDLDWQSSSPLERLLDPSEFEFLRTRGVSEKRIAELRARRRSIFRMYIRRLTVDFHTTHETLQAVLVSAREDRPDLARELARQKLFFYRGVIVVEIRLMLNALGFNRVPVPSLALIRPLERLHLEIGNLVPDLSGAAA
jgi:hypothetical protein